MIQCEFKQRPEFTCLPSKFKKPKLKSGKYHGSCFWSIPEFGRNCWVVVADLQADFEKALQDPANLSRVVEECLEFLNQPLKKKRKTKKNPNPKFEYEYGFLRSYWSDIKKDPLTQKMSVQVHLITDDPRNKNFWGEGMAVTTIAIKSRRNG